MIFDPSLKKETVMFWLTLPSKSYMVMLSTLTTSRALAPRTRSSVQLVVVREKAKAEMKKKY